MSIHNQNIETHSEEETKQVARDLSKLLGQGDVLLLHGDLGMGKTVFSRALIRALCGDDDLEVPSPTFTLVQSYDSPKGTIWHFDLYRLSDPSEIYEIGWEEALSGGIVLVEWPERLGAMKPGGAIEITLSGHKEHPDKRTIEIVKNDK